MIGPSETLSKPLRFYATRSFWVHAFLILVAILLGQFAYKAINVERIKNIKIIESSVKVDIVAMPELTLKELKVLSQDRSGFRVKIDEGKKDPAPKVQDKGPTLLKKKKKIDFQDMLKNLAKKNKDNAKKSKKVIKKNAKKNIVNQDKGLSNSERQNLKKLLLKGNKLRQGNAAVGTTDAAAQGQFETYVAQIPSHVKPHWKLPSYLLSQDFVCRIRIFLESNGRLLRAEIFQSSGNEEYDKKALAAVKASSPFPNLPKDIKIRGARGDILLGFPL